MTGGAVYTRWGRSSCPSDDSELVYEGNIRTKKDDAQNLIV